jgi:hypothetical protein
VIPDQTADPEPRVAFVTTAPEVLQGADTDRPRHEAAFARSGIRLEHCVWWDPSVEWDRYDLVVIRSPWDYVERLDEFRRWLHRMDPLDTLCNPASLVEWNLDKRYLLELADRGVPIIPTRVATSGAEVDQLLRTGWEEVVLKPVVSAGGRNTGRFPSGDPRARALAGRILDEGVAVMVQPAVASVPTHGETSAVVFDGAISHSLRRGAILGPGGSHLAGSHLDDASPRPLGAGQRDLVDSVMGTVAAIGAGLASDRATGSSPPLYARVDMVTLDDGRDAVIEVELTEPSFFLSVDPAAADRFRSAVDRHRRRRGSRVGAERHVVTHGPGRHGRASVRTEAR